VLAYLFWHRPRTGAEAGDYEELIRAFHHSLARSLPAGMIASASYRLEAAPWLEGPLYEDWYLVEDFSALGVLNEAAVGRGHRTSHDEAARRSGRGAGGLYALLEGEPDAGALAQATVAVWVDSAPAKTAAERSHGELAGMLGDGMEPRSASLWRRQLVLGPAPEYCLIGSEVPSGVRASRLPAGWSATVLEREAVCSG